VISPLSTSGKYVPSLGAKLTGFHNRDALALGRCHAGLSVKLAAAALSACVIDQRFEVRLLAPPAVDVVVVVVTAAAAAAAAAAVVVVVVVK
jgi:hypothetical protein